MARAQLPQKGPGYVPSARMGKGTVSRRRKSTMLAIDVAAVGAEPAFRSVAWDGVARPLPPRPADAQSNQAARTFHGSGTRRSQKRRQLEIDGSILVRAAFGGVAWGGDVVEERPTDRQVALQTRNVLNSFGWE